MVIHERTDEVPVNITVNGQPLNTVISYTFTYECKDCPEPQPDSDLYDNFDGQNYTLTDGQISPNGKWMCVFTGGNPIEVRDGQMFQKPRTANRRNRTYASLVQTTEQFSDFELTVDVRTIRPLRTGDKPNNWETAWIIWNRIDLCHGYAFFQKYIGSQLEKKDSPLGYPDCDPAQEYLATLNSPSVVLDMYSEWRIRVTDTNTGKPHIQVDVDGTRIIDMVDIKENSNIMKQGGYIGLYNEDAEVSFDDVYIERL